MIFSAVKSKVSTSQFKMIMQYAWPCMAFHRLTVNGVTIKVARWFAACQTIYPNFLARIIGFRIY